MKRDDVKQSMKHGWNKWRTEYLDDDNTLVADSFCTYPCKKGIITPLEAESWQSQFRKHFAHRRSLFPALTFGAAALAELISRFVTQYNSEVKLFALHIYVLSAIIAVTGKRFRLCLPTTSDSNLVFWNPEKLEDLGDLLFLVACVMDAVLMDFNFKAPIVSVLAACFWLVDSCLYFRADIVRAKQANEADSNYLI
jgi:hypothetical protein